MPDDDVLDISSEDLEDEPLPPAPPVAPPIEITMDDLGDEPADAFPALTADQMAADRKSITIPTICSATGQRFAVRYVEKEPGLFVSQEVVAGDNSAAGLAGGGTTSEVQGRFGTTADYRCPFCGSTAIIVCGQCGTDLCSGGIKGGRCTCPNCKATMNNFGGSVTSATGFVGGKGKGK